MGSAIRIAFVYFLIPVYGIKSYVWGIAVSFFVTDILNLFAVTKVTGLLLNVRKWLLGPAVVGIFMIIIGRYIYYLFDIFVESSIIITLLSLASSIVIGMLLMIAVGAVDFKDLKLKNR